jgi:hypothetical protein
MGDEDLSQLRREIREKFSESQVEMLKGLRDELASRRWQLILDIDIINELIRLAIAKTEEQYVKEVLSKAIDKLSQVEQLIARIPDDFIPAF